ncbi:MAG: sugar phosphorylase, partial [Planctomycetota bacterium]
ASHDGIGVRPLEGLVPDERLNVLVQAVRSGGGRVNTRRRADGTDSPYELNITYRDAVARPGISRSQHAARFLATQAIMLTLQGIPAVYFHSLVGSPNDIDGMLSSGQNRRINRHKYQRDDLDRAISTSGLQQDIFRGYCHLLDKRKGLPALHPAADQRLIASDVPGLLMYQRTNETSGDTLLVLANLSEQIIETPDGIFDGTRRDQLTDENVNGSVPLAPFQVRWLRS